MPESRDRTPPEECANCGAAVPRTAKACPECGADERTGWREQSVYDGLDLPAEAFETDDGSAPSPREKRRVNGVPWYWWCVGAALLALLVLSLVAGR
jgi:predicted nucleic acid-binding Zn ribbon protein